MKKLLVLLIIIGSVTFAQVAPLSYKLGNEKIGKVSDALPKSNSILDICVEGNDIWLGTSRGVSYTTDNGENWTNFFGKEPFGEESIIALAYKDGVVYAATGHSTEQTGESFPEGSGLRVSTDMGNTWLSTPQSINDNGDSSIVYGVSTLRALPVTTTIQNISYDIAVGAGYVWTANFAGGLRRSSNYGESWERVVLPPDYLDEIHPDSNYSFVLQPQSGKFGSDNNLNHRVFSVTVISDSMVAVGTAGGVNVGYILENGDIHWKKANHTNQTKPLSGNFITGISWDEASHGLWAVTRKAEGASEFFAVSVSYDTAKTWQVYLSGERAHNIGFKNYTTGGAVRTDVFVCADGGIFRTNDFGQTWLTPSNIIDEKSQSFYDIEKFYSMAHYNYNGTDYIYLGSAADGLIKFEETGTYWDGIYNVYTASEGLAGLSDTYAFPNPFSPNQEKVRIKYKLDSAGDVTIRIFDFGMNLVKTLIQNVSKSANSENFELWDGLDEYGSNVSNGVYFYRIDVGDNDPVFGKIMVLR